MQHVSVTKEEIDALDMTVTVLVGRDSEARLGVLSGLFAGEGDIGQDIPCKVGSPFTTVY